MVESSIQPLLFLPLSRTLLDDHTIQTTDNILIQTPKQRTNHPRLKLTTFAAATICLGTLGAEAVNVSVSI